MTILRVLLPVTLGFVLAEGASSQPDSTLSVVPGGRYGSVLTASGINRFFWGSDYRTLWSTPIDVPLLDTRTFAGGLEVQGVDRVEGNRTLRLRGRDGVRYSFRRLDVSPADLLPPELKIGFAGPLLQDQMSSALPTAIMILPLLLDALEVLHTEPHLVVIPEREGLGEARKEFVGVPGFLQAMPEPGFEGATRILSTGELDSLMAADPRQHLDLRALLTARLFDVWVGDWERRRSHWLWADTGEGDPPAWLPIPIRQYQAFARYDGVILGLARGRYPQITKFGERYPDVFGATWRGHSLDRRHLVGLEGSVWDSVATSIQNRLPDDLIRNAVRAMPTPHFEEEGETLVRALIRRRDDLPRMAEDYYRLLAGDVDVHGTDRADRFLIDREEGGVLWLRWWSRREAWTPNDSLGAPRTSRRFLPQETEEVRLYLGGGSNLVEIRGEPTGGIKLRVIAGSGQDLVVDETGQHETLVYDERGEGGVRAPGLQVDRRPFTPPVPLEPGVPARDWGTRGAWSLLADFAGDVDLVLTAKRVWEKLGFRTFPYRRQHRVMLSYSTGQTAPRAEYRYRRHWENSARYMTLRTLGSGFEVTRFHGFGNDTPSGNGIKDFFKVKQDLLQADGSLHERPSIKEVLITGRNYVVDFSGGVTFRYTSTDDGESTFVGVTQPYGSGRFGYMGVFGEFEYDTRDLPAWPRGGHHARVGGSFYPGIWDLRQGAFGEVHASAAGYIPILGGPTLAWRAGGKRVWGVFPFGESASIGGKHSNRGYDRNRFSGSSALFGGLDLRFFLFRYGIIVPGEVGALLFADAGRVWYEGESSNDWHPSLGAGLWVAPGARSRTVSLSAAASDEGFAVYFSSGFAF